MINWLRMNRRTPINLTTNCCLVHYFKKPRLSSVQLPIFFISSTGCPTILAAPLCFLTFSRVLEHIQRNFWPFYNSPGNLLHDSHKNFENWFRNSLDIWGQSWHPSFRNWHFSIKMRQKKISVKVATLTSIIYYYF